MRVSYILAAIVIIVIVLGFRLLLGRYFTLEGRTLGAVSAMDKAAKKYDDAADALAALLDVNLQSGDPISQTLLTACNSWDATVGAHLSPGDPVPQAMKEARPKFTAADLALSLARDRVQTLTGSDPYSRHDVKNDRAGATSAVQLAADSGAPYTVGLLLAGQGDQPGRPRPFNWRSTRGSPRWRRRLQ
jgi:hypothetical protein